MKPLSPLLLLLLLLPLSLASVARADELSKMLEKGPMVRVDTDSKGAFDAVVAVVDVDASADVMWSILLDYHKYRFFLPRVREVVVDKDAKGNTLVKWNLDTPLVATKYTNLMIADEKNKYLTARTIEGDMAGSHYDWRVVPLGENRCRMFHTAWPRNMASIVDTLDDKQQTLLIGVAVGSALATVRGFSGRAELAAKSPMSISAP